MSTQNAIARFVKSPTETIDYDFDFADWLADREDSIASFSVTLDAGLSLVSSSLANSGIVRAFVAGGTAGRLYRASALVTTTGERVKQALIEIRVIGTAAGSASTSDPGGGIGGIDDGAI